MDSSLYCTLLRGNSLSTIFLQICVRFGRKRRKKVGRSSVADRSDDDSNEPGVNHFRSRRRNRGGRRWAVDRPPSENGRRLAFYIRFRAKIGVFTKIRRGERGNGRCAYNIYIGLERNEKAYFKLDRLTRWRLDFRAPRSNDDERARYRRIRQRESGQFPQRGSERSIFGELWNWWKSRDRVEIAILRVHHSTRQSFFG